MTSKFASNESFKNNTQTPLAADATFTGGWEDCRVHDAVSVAVKADQSCTLYIDFTSNPSSGSVDSSLSYVISANINEVHRLTITRPFFRVRIVNDSVEQTYLSVSSMVGSHTQLSAPMNLNLGLDSDAIAVRPTEPQDEIVIGRRPGVSHFNQFGYREGLTASAGEETIWATTGNFVPMTTASTFTITYTPASDGSTSTGAHTLYFVYVDENGLKQIGTHTLGSSGSDVTSFSGLGINRCAVSSCGSNQTNGADIIITETTGGTKQTVIVTGQGTTQQCIFHTDANSDAIGKYLNININKLSGGSSPRVTVKGYVFNRQFEIRFEIFRMTIDTSAENTVNLFDPIGFLLSPTDVLYFVADTDTNNTTVTLRVSLNEYKRN